MVLCETDDLKGLYPFFSKAFSGCLLSKAALKAFAVKSPFLIEIILGRQAL